jgi:hypothetical protein
MKKFIIILLLAVAVITSLAAATFPWCADQDVFFWNASSDISGYRVMNHTPELDSQRSITTPSFSSSSGEIVVGTWATPIGSPGVNTLAPGLWRFRSYAYSSSTSGSTTLKFYAINRSSSGTETNLFYGNAITQDIDATGLPAEYLTSYARRNSTTFFNGDRLVIRVNASTSSSSARTITYLLAGNTNASMVSISYFLCDAVSGSAQASSGAMADGSEQLPMNPAIPILSITLIVIISARKRT